MSRFRFSRISPSPSRARSNQPPVLAGRCAAAQEQPATSTPNSSQPENSPAPADVRAIIAQTKPEDYDGHTEFSRMTPAQRLTWLDQAVLFIAAQKDAKKSWEIAEEPSDMYKVE